MPTLRPVLAAAVTAALLAAPSTSATAAEITVDYTGQGLHSVRSTAVNQARADVQRQAQEGGYNANSCAESAPPATWFEPTDIGGVIPRRVAPRPIGIWHAEAYLRCVSFEPDPPPPPTPAPSPTATLSQYSTFLGWAGYGRWMYQTTTGTALPTYTYGPRVLGQVAQEPGAGTRAVYECVVHESWSYSSLDPACDGYPQRRVTGYVREQPQPGDVAWYRCDIAGSPVWSKDEINGCSDPLYPNPNLLGYIQP